MSEVHNHAATTEAEAEAAVDIAEEQTAQTEAAAEAAVEVERLRQEGETERAEIEAEAAAEIAEVIAEAEGEEWRGQVSQLQTELAEHRAMTESRLSEMSAQLSRLVSISPTPTEPMESEGTSLENPPSGAGIEPEAAQEAEEPPRPRRRWT